MSGLSPSSAVRRPVKKSMPWQKTVVVGAGPVGALAALYAARRGDQVEIYELRGDLRDPSSVPLNFTKSINLALSERGINSIRLAQAPGLLKSILDDTIPMHGRMIHGEKNGELFEDAQAYDVNGRSIKAADRGGLNKRMLDELEALPNVKLHFNWKLTGADFKRSIAWFENQSKDSTNDTGRRKEIEIHFDLLIGADGAHSATRFHLMKYQRLTYHQEYIDTLWCEFQIPPADPSIPSNKHNGFRISPHHLHIWPAGSLMFIAIPSTDQSFTCTLFMSASNFDRIDESPSKLESFFHTNFPGVVNDLISPDALRQQYTANPHLPLINIKCEPYHYGSSVVILGDAAHAMVPFYGQGMNTGLEDVRVLYDVLDRFDPPMRTSRRSFTAEGRAWNRAAALAEYSFIRRKDAHTINDLAMGNYQEMREGVTSKVYLARKGIEEWLSVWVPWTGFRTQYSRVSFSNERYSEVAWNVAWQHAALDIAGVVVGSSVAAAAGLALWRWRKA